MGIDKKSLILAAAVAGFIAGTTNSNVAFADSHKAKSEKKSEQSCNGECAPGKCGGKKKKHDCKEHKKGEKCDKSKKGAEEGCGGKKRDK